jgi:hypothetical protein
MVNFEAVYDPVRGKQAVDRLAVIFQSVDLTNREKLRPNLDMGRVAIAILAASHYASIPEIRRAFELLPPEFFDIRHLDMLTDLGWAAWYAKARYAELLSRKVRAIVPAELARRVAARKQRMLRVVDYYLHDHPTAGVAIQALRKAGGYVDDASDLTILASLYRDHKEVLSVDRKLYREEDLREAEEDAAALMRFLGVGSGNETKQALDLLTRIFVVIQDSYDKVRAAASFALANKPEHLRGFPALYTAARRAPKAKNPDLATASIAPAVQPSQIAHVPQEPSLLPHNDIGPRGPFVD